MSLKRCLYHLDLLQRWPRLYHRLQLEAGRRRQLSDSLRLTLRLPVFDLG